MKPCYSVFTIIFLCFLLSAKHVYSQSASVDQKRWNAYWIDVPGKVNDYEICLFRKELNLTTKPGTYKVNVSADNRYKLFVNGELVSTGPARSDFYYWNYETIDLAPYL